MAAQIRIIGVGPNNEELNPSDQRVDRWWVRDRRGRTREYDSLERAQEAADTFRGLGFVLLDEEPPAVTVVDDRTEAAKAAVAKEEMQAFDQEIVADLVDEWKSDLRSAFPRDAAEIAAIGHIPNRHIEPGADGLDVYIIAPIGDPILTIPRGLAPHLSLMLIEAWKAGCDYGFEWGTERAQAAVGSLPTRPGA